MRWARSAVLALLAAGCGSSPSLTVASGTTKVTFALAPFGIAVANAGGTARGGPGCGPLALALRADGDTGTYHAPDAPRPELRWLRSTTARVLAGAPLTLEVSLAADDGTAGP